MPKTELIRVYPNPFTFVDHEGRPAGHVQYEPTIGGAGDAQLRWIGCGVVASHVRKASDKPEHRLRGLQDQHWWGDAHDHYWEYATEPTIVPLTGYYLRLIQHHDLFVADVESHEKVFGSRDGFVDPKQRLAQLARERDCVPFLQASADLDGSKPRDHKAEWEAFTRPAVPPAAPATAPKTTTRSSAAPAEAQRGDR
jgi:hypothetical protein